MKLKNNILLLFTICMFSNVAFSQDTSNTSSFYFAWGYNVDKYSNSDIHFKSETDNYDFTFHNVTAHDKPDFDNIYKTPLQISIPQYNYRIGYFINKSNGLEISFDHAKYVVTDYQTVRASGQIYGNYFDKDTLLDPKYFHFEHTDGANFLMLNYVKPIRVLINRKNYFNIQLKPGLGIVIPRSDVRLFGERQNQCFHIAGEIIGLEASVRFDFLKHFFAELAWKKAYANFHNVLLPGDGIAKHRFWVTEGILTLGYFVDFKKNKKII